MNMQVKIFLSQRQSMRSSLKDQVVCHMFVMHARLSQDAP